MRTILLDKISAASRRKSLAVDTRPISHPFCRWDSKGQRYLGVLEIYDAKTGDKYQLITDREEWERIYMEMMKRFAGE